MIIEALMYKLENEEQLSRQIPISVDDAKDLSLAREEHAPCVLVVREQSIDDLKRFEDLVKDMGLKHRNIQLSRLLLGKKEIPVIQGNYRQAGQLEYSLRAFLNNVADRQDRNLYIIGVNDLLYEELVKRTFRNAVNLKAANRNTRSPRPEAFSGGYPGSSGHLIGLLPDIEEPQALKETYLGSSSEVILVRKLILQAARVDFQVLILGESGTGKGVVARQIHKYHMDRSDYPFVSVNCGALPSTIFESEMFGSKKGSYTDSKVDREGLWKSADGGTLFLDEVGEIPLADQVKILKALEEGKIRAVGADKEEPVNLRIIAATNLDLTAMVQAGRFREDLYYRIKGFLIRTPALRDHPQDIPELAQKFWLKLTKEKTRKLPPDLLDLLATGHNWPGNVRELKMVLTNLFSLFYNVSRLTKEHLRAVFELEGRPLTPAIDLDGPGNRKAVRYLQRVLDTIRSARIALARFQPALGSEGATQDALLTLLRSLNQNLELNCQYPLRFGSEEAYGAASSISSKVNYLIGLLLEKDQAGIEYSKRLEREIKQAESLIQDTMSEIWSVYAPSPFR